MTVLLLEAGPDDRKHPEVNIPGKPEVAQQTKLDWQYFTEPQKHGLDGFIEKVSQRSRM